MRIKKGTLNPLNVLGIRYLERAPKYFFKISVNLNCDDRTVKRWIFNNLNGRFNVSKDLIVVDNNHMIETSKIGFEDQREATLFMLKCPYLEDRRK